MCSNVDENRLKARRLADRGILTLGKAEQEALKLMQKSIRDASIIIDKKVQSAFQKIPQKSKKTTTL